MNQELLNDFDSFTEPTNDTNTSTQVNPLLDDFDSFTGGNEPQANNQQMPSIQMQPQQQFQQDNHTTQEFQPQMEQQPQSESGFFDYLKSQYDNYSKMKLDTPLKKVGGAMMATMGSTPLSGIKQASDTIDYAKSDYGKAMSMKASKDNLEFEFNDLKKMIDSGLGDANATAQVKQKKDALYTSLAKTLNDNDVEAFYKDGKLKIITKDKDGNEQLIDLDENTLANIGHGFLASGGEIGAGIAGAGTGAVAANRMMPPMATPIQRGVATTVGGLAGGYAGSTTGAVVDLIRDSLILGEKIDAREIASKATARGVADLTGVTALTTVGKGVSKGIIKPIAGGVDKLKTLFANGNIQGAKKIVMEDYGLSSKDIDNLYEEVKRNIDGWEDLEGDDLLRAKLTAAVQQQNQGKTLMLNAVMQSPRAAIETSKEIEGRAKQVISATTRTGGKPSDLIDNIATYSKQVKKNYGEVRKLISDALPNYKANLDLNSFRETILDVNKRVIDPDVKLKIENLAEVLSNQPNQTIDDLIENRQLFNKFYKKNSKHFASQPDKEALMSILKTIDTKIDEALESVDGGEVSKSLRNALEDAKAKYTEMANTKDTAIYSSLFQKNGKPKKGLSEEVIGKALIKYSKSVDGDLEKVLEKLTPSQRVNAEFSILNQFTKNATNKKGAKAVDFEKLINHIQESGSTFKSPEAKLFIKNIDGFNKKFAHDVDLQATATSSVAPKTKTNIATDAIGKAKVMGATKIFESFQRLLLSDRGRRLSLQKSIELALEKSRTPKEFFYKVLKTKPDINEERAILKKSVDEIRVKQQTIKDEALELQKKNKQSIENAQQQKQQQQSDKIRQQQKDRKAKFEKAKEAAQQQKLNEQAQKAKDSKEIPIGGSEDETKEVTKEVFKKNKSDDAKYKNMSKEDIAEEERLFQEDKINNSDADNYTFIGSKSISDEKYQGLKATRLLVKNKKTGEVFMGVPEDIEKGDFSKLTEVHDTEKLTDKSPFAKSSGMDSQDKDEMVKEYKTGNNYNQNLDQEANEVFSKFADNLAAGTIAGIDKDENGNITFDAEKFVAGLGGYTAVKQLIKNPKAQREFRGWAKRALNELDDNPKFKAISGKSNIVESGKAPKNAPRFYSHMKDTIEQDSRKVYTKKDLTNIVMKKGKEVKQGLFPSKGVKEEEIQWSGIQSLLDSMDDTTKITKKELLSKIRQPELDTITKHSGKGEVLSGDEYSRRIDIAERAGNWDESERLTREWEDVELQGTLNGGDTKYQKYTTKDANGKNYKENLTVISPAEERSSKQINREYDEMWNELQKVERGTKERDIINAKLEEINDRLQASYKKQIPHNEYKSPHYDEPNILLTTRTQDMKIDGDKTLFAEEIQSDWHQAGRKSGYKNPDLDKQITDVYKEMDDYKTPFIDKYGKSFWEGMTPEETAKLDEIGDRASKLMRERDKLGNAVPQAPYSKTWHEKAIKDLIAEAVEGDYKRVAWTSGKTQADRYSLSKQIDSLDARYDSASKTYDLSAFKNDSNLGTAIGDNIPEDKLADYVGKEMAERIIKDNGGNYSGLDLEIGGEGMKGFYDKMLPNWTNKYIKKYGSKVEVKTLPNGDEVWSFDVTQKMIDDVKAKGQPLYTIPIAGAGVGLSQQTEDNNH